MLRLGCMCVLQYIVVNVPALGRYMSRYIEH